MILVAGGLIAEEFGDFGTEFVFLGGASKCIYANSQEAESGSERMV